MDNAREVKLKRKRSDSPVAAGSTLPPREPTSSQKRKKLLVKDDVVQKQGTEIHRSVIDEEHVKIIVETMLCPVCCRNDVTVKFIHHQIDTYMTVKCECGYEVLNTQKTVNVKEKNFQPLTMMLIYSLMLIGSGYDGANKIISFLGLKHFTENTFIRYAKHITINAVNHAKNVLEKTRTAVFHHYASKEDALVDGNVDVDVTFDGSWHKRGHKSNFGIGAVIDVDCGLVLDYEVSSKLCSQCDRKKQDLLSKKITESEYVYWLEEEHLHCDENYEGSSGAMEAAEAVEMWGRSKNYNLLYKTFVSDGDSSAYKAVCDMSPYGTGTKDMVIKAECINHVAKRLGTSMRALKKARGASMGGKNKLTEVVIDNLQFYFQVSLKRKVGTSPSEMREEIMSTYFHCISTDDKPQHDKCAKGVDSWCFYNKSIALGMQPESHKKMRVYFHLT